jgi:uncharacterized protein
MALMDLTHRFSVPTGVHEAWNAFNDVEQLAPCFPGVTITDVAGEEFTGKLKIKLGPSILVYNGSGRYLERNEAERRLVIEADGKEKRRNGTAAVTVSASFTENGSETDVVVLTNLAISGKPAHLGDEVIADVSEKLLDQFVNCISHQFADSFGSFGMVSANGAVAVGAATEIDEADTEQTIELEPVPAAPVEAARSRIADSSLPASKPGPSAAAGLTDFTPPVTEPTSPHVSEPARYPPQGDLGRSAVNVLSAVVPIVLKRYGPALAIVGLLLFIAIKIIRRKS